VLDPVFGHRPIVRAGGQCHGTNFSGLWWTHS
jgi:hypothetical protein